MFISHVAHVGKSVLQLQAMSRAPDGAKKKLHCSRCRNRRPFLFSFQPKACHKS